MKPATDAYGRKQTEPPLSGSQEHGRSVGLHYILVAVLLGVAYLVASWVPAAPEAFSLQFGSGFLLFWLAGGLITLALLTRAAKR